MALKRDTLYPGRFTAADMAHPQGAFKNRSTPTAQDGSYLEAQWANDWDGFFARILNVAGITPNGVADTGTSSQLYDALLVAMPRRLINVRFFTQSGMYTPSEGTKRVRVRIQGAGGAGGGSQVTNGSQFAAGSGGTAGAYGETSLIDISGVSSVNIVVGTGGAGVQGGAGGKGGDSVFGSYITAPGGGGGYVGIANNATTVAASGLSYSDACSGNSVAVSSKGQGGDGPVIVGTTSSSQVKGGGGGSSYFGAGARAGNGADGAVVQSAQAIGSGGSGRAVGVGSTSPLAGGNGAAGIIIVEEYS